MSSPFLEPAESIGTLVELIGFRLSTATILFHQAVADRLGVSATEVKCYSILRQAGPITAGELAERTGLTTGAITGVVDRLERADLVRRVRDPHDRRRIVLELVANAERERALAQLYQPMGRAITQLVAQYSAAERATLLDFLTKATAVLEAETTALRQGTVPGKATGKERKGE
ncbi:MAG TPA: MarR family transcriptional regulator [Roseiflexaceae bacterium]|nr:MarR family transcriptional regulator [Roseiflexaceae bacterium]